MAGESLPDVYCNQNEVPHLVRQCENSPCLKVAYQWRTSPWGAVSLLNNSIFLLTIFSTFQILSIQTFVTFLACRKQVHVDKPTLLNCWKFPFKYSVRFLGKNAFLFALNLN